MIWSWLLFICIPIVQGKGNDSKKKIKIDAEHLKIDFAGILGPIASFFSDYEMDFRYFTAHDYDKNNKLDGLELFTALEHDSEHATDDVPHKSDHNSDDIEKQVDDIFEDADDNNDGFLDYKEFMTIQRLQDLTLKAAL